MRRWLAVWVATALALVGSVVVTPAQAAVLPFQLYLPVPANANVQAGGTHPMNGIAGTRSSVDIGAAGGGQMDVTAAAAGTVTAVASGCSVRIQHADGWQTNYYHLKGIPGAIAVGAKVTAGQKIGEMGLPTVDTCGSGNFRHLHFSLLRNGVDVDLSQTSIGGFTVYGTGGNYCGYWMRNSDGAVVADARSACEAVNGFANNQVLPGPSGLRSQGGSDLNGDGKAD